VKTIQTGLPGLTTKIALQDGNLITGTEQDCTPFVEDVHNRVVAEATGTKDVKHAARLPNVLIEQYCNTHGIGFDEFMQNPVHARVMCNDPALASFRIWFGRV